MRLDSGVRVLTVIIIHAHIMIISQEKRNRAGRQPVLGRRAQPPQTLEEEQKASMAAHARICRAHLRSGRGHNAF